MRSVIQVKKKSVVGRAEELFVHLSEHLMDR